uniref:Class 2 KNOX protein n=1 Tax=Thelypteris nipponica TaxID=2925009 RepID=A0A2U9QGG4_9MONI|nr:class 2 KNOX protein [Coryphopteris nipponica]
MDKKAPLLAKQPFFPADACLQKLEREEAYDELFGADAGMKAGIIAHPLFEQLLTAHVACLRVGTPLEEQHIIDSALAKRHHVAAKYLALLTHLQSLSQPNDDQELNDFMVNYILLLESFKEKILDHLHTEASKAIIACQEIEQELFNLTGVSKVSSHKKFTTMTQEDEKLDNELGISRLGISSFLPYNIQKTLRDHLRKELKQELKKDYHTKLKEVHDEIVRKRRAGKLPEDTTHILKNWWISHGKWPYPTEEEKAKLMAETRLDLKQINNWFSNQRKKDWHIKRKSSKGDASSCISTTSSLNCEEES